MNQRLKSISRANGEQKGPHPKQTGKEIGRGKKLVKRWEKHSMCADEMRWLQSISCIIEESFHFDQFTFHTCWPPQTTQAQRHCQLKLSFAPSTEYTFKPCDCLPKKNKNHVPCNCRQNRLKKPSLEFCWATAWSSCTKSALKTDFPTDGTRTAVVSSLYV